MTEDNRERKRRRLRKWRIGKLRFSFLPLIASLFMSLIFIGSAGGGIIPTICSNLTGCNISTGPIVFDQSVTAITSSDQTAQVTINVTTSELIVLGIPTQAATVATTSHNIQSVRDSVGNVYALAVHGQSSTFQTMASWESYELWSSFVNPALNLIIYVTWKTIASPGSGSQIFFVSAYRNAFGLGNTAHLDNVTIPAFGNTQTVNIVESKNGGWIVGGAIVGDGVNNCTITSVPGQTQRQLHTYSPSVELSVSDLQDKGPLLNGTNTYSEKFWNPCGPFTSTATLVAAEIIPQINEQINECTSTNGLCSSTSSCPLTPSPCWTKIQTGFTTCTIGIGAVTCLSPTITFNPAYSVKPFVFLSFNASSTRQINTIATYNAVPLKFAFQSGDNGILTGISWVSMPAALTELYSATDMRVDWNYFLPFLSALPATYFCVNLDTQSSSAGAILKPQYSSDMITWNDFSPALAVPIDGSFGVGKICTGGNLTVPASNAYTLRVVGVGGGGLGDNPSFGNIELTIYGQGTIPTKAACVLAEITLTTSSFKIIVTCGSIGNTGPAAAFTMNWWAGLKG